MLDDIQCKRQRKNNRQAAIVSSLLLRIQYDFTPSSVFSPSCSLSSFLTSISLWCFFSCVRFFFTLEEMHFSCFWHEINWVVTAFGESCSESFVCRKDAFIIFVMWMSCSRSLSWMIGFVRNWQKHTENGQIKLYSLVVYCSCCCWFVAATNVMVVKHPQFTGKHTARYNSIDHLFSSWWNVCVLYCSCNFPASNLWRKRKFSRIDRERERKPINLLKCTTDSLNTHNSEYTRTLNIKHFTQAIKQQWNVPTSTKAQHNESMKAL